MEKQTKDSNNQSADKKPLTGSDVRLLEVLRQQEALQKELDQTRYLLQETEAGREILKLKRMLLSLKQQTDRLAELEKKSVQDHEENAALSQQVLALRKMLEESNARNKENQENLQDVQSKLQEWQSKGDNERALRLTLEENTRHSEHLERVIKHLRDRAEESRLEADSLREELLRAREELAKAVQSSSQEEETVTEDVKDYEAAEVLYRQQIEEYRLHLKEALESSEKGAQLYRQLESEYARQQEDYRALELRWNEASHQLASLEHQQRLAAGDLENKEKSLEELVGRLTAAQQEKHQLEEACLSAQSANEDKEARIKIAQQHLAKKVKETSVLTEKIEAQQAILEQLEQELSLSRGRCQELQIKYDWQVQQEKRLQEQLQEALKNVDDRDAKWETKYFQLYEKWQESEWRNRELKALEERYHHLQSILSNVGTVISAPAPVLPPRIPASGRDVFQVVDTQNLHPFRQEAPSPPPLSRLKQEFYDDGG